MSIDKLKNAFSHATWKNDVKHYFKKINEIIDWINNIGSTTVPDYKVYRALLTQTGTDAPSVFVQENSLGFDLTFEYSGAGDYYTQFPINYPTNKVHYTVTNRINGGASLSTTGGYYFSSTNAFFGILTFNDSGVYTNGILENTPIEIKVYN